MLKKWFKKMYIKWVRGECRHLCCMCDYRNVCEEEFEYEENKTAI